MHGLIFLFGILLMGYSHAQIDPYALDFGDNAQQGLFDCGNSKSLDLTEATIEAWIKHRWVLGTTDPVNMFSNIVTKPYSDVTFVFPFHKIFEFGRNGNTYQLLFTYRESMTGGTSALTDFTGNNDVPFNQWTHVAVTYSLQTQKVTLYINGIQDASIATKTNAIGLYSNRTQHVYIGGPHTIYAEGYTGIMDEVRIWNIARTQKQLFDFMNCSLAGNEPGLVGYYTFSEGNINRIKDHSTNGNDCTYSSFNNTQKITLVSGNHPTNPGCTSSISSIVTSIPSTVANIPSTIANIPSTVVGIGALSSTKPASFSIMLLVEIIAPIGVLLLVVILVVTIILVRKRKKSTPYNITLPSATSTPQLSLDQFPKLSGPSFNSLSSNSLSSITSTPQLSAYAANQSTGYSQSTSSSGHTQTRNTQFIWPPKRSVMIVNGQQGYICQRCDEKNANNRCENCNSYFCSECSGELHSNGKWLNHKVSMMY